jgi:hypothetical protein
LGIATEDAAAAANAIKPPRLRWSSSLYSRTAQFHHRP